MADQALGARRLYEEGFEGWDLSQGTYATDYLIMFIGIICAGIIWQAFGKSWASFEVLSAQFSTFALLEGLCFGFGGVTHHILDTYYENGQIMRKTWFAPQSEWMYAWTFALLLGPLASACCLSTACAFSELGIGWGRAAKVGGTLVAILEVLMCFAGQIDSTGTLALYWTLISSVFSAVLSCWRGAGVPGFIGMLTGNVCRFIGCCVIVSAPAACRSAGWEREEECPFPEDFNHNAVFHVFVAVSIILLFIGAGAKLGRERDIAYMEMMRNHSTKDTGRFCGC